MELLTAGRDYVTTQANKHFLFLIILILFTHKISQASINDKVLVTDNFVINFNIETGAYTFAIASRLEAYNSIIASFFETEFLERVNVYIYNKSENISSSIDNIYISIGENFFDTEKKLYEDLFFIYLKKLTHSDDLAKINKNFIEALISFPKTEQGDLRLILNDLINISLISSINIENIGTLPEAVQQEVYTVFIHHAISNYGKKIFIQSLKDTEYYNGFFKSLSGITGESINKISESFNLFLQNSRKDILDIDNNIENNIDNNIKNNIKNKKLLIDSDDKFSDVSFSVINENKENKENKVAILQKDKDKYKDKYRFLLKDRDEVKVIPLKVSETGSYFNNIVFLNSNLIAITEIVKTGSKLYIFDLLKYDFTDSIIIPMIFIKDINPAKNEDLIFSAYCGLTIDIYTFNIKNREFKVITESGYNSNPVMTGNKKYYISLYKGVNRLFVEEY